MAQVINTNSLSLITQNNINKNQSAMSTAIERLSSGLRINSAKDDAAGQAIANRFTSNINGLTQAARNANDGISIAQTTEGALSEINNNLQRVRELTVQSQNGTNSQSDLDSIQDEITSRLDEIDRVSGQTQFNGVKVLSGDNTLKIQVGANDGETINIDLKKITSDTLGLNGFNVNGTGTVNNKAATISDLTAAKATTNADGNYVVTTANAALTASQALDKLSDGDTVDIKTYSDATTSTTTSYKFDAAAGNFTYTNNANNTSTKAGDLADTLLPAAGQTKTGTYKAASGEVSFDVDATGNLTIGGQKAYLTDDGNLTTNNSGSASDQATLNSLFTLAGDGKSLGNGGTASVTLDSTTYNFQDAADVSVAADVTAAEGVTYTATASKDVVLAQVQSAKQAAGTAAANDTVATVNYNSGVMQGSATFANGKGTATGETATAGTSVTGATGVYVDGNDALTSTASYTTTYSVNADNGEVSVVSGTGTGKFAPEVGAQAYVSSAGKLTTDTTSAGTATTDPLAALDDAISNIDKFRSSLGAVQNRLDSAVTNLNNTTTNLSEAQSRIQDADYATEVSNMSKAQIIQQAGNSVLAKANQVPQQILSLLQG